MQPAFAAGRFVLVDKAFGDGGINHGLGRLESRLGFFLVAFLDSKDNFFDKGTHVAALPCIANTALFGLFRAFFCLCCIGHVVFLVQIQL
jgi:hypothetical protein